MPHLLLDRVSFAYCDTTPLLVDVQLRLDAGWTGVVGPNGAGKTTLLHLLRGALRPDDGVCRSKPASLRTVWCPQTVEARPPEVVALAEEASGTAGRLRSELALDPGRLDAWPQLSPGERKRWQVAAALRAEPDALLLDEPTNHLDADARDRLVAALARFRGIGVVVSHDRTLLEALTERTVRVLPGQLECFHGGYASARAAWEQAEREQASAAQRLDRDKKKLRRRLGDARRKRDEADAKRKRIKRTASKADIDTRTLQRQSRRRSAENALGREVQKLHGALGRLDERRAGFALAKEKGRSLFVDWEPAPRGRLLGLDGATLEAGGRVLVRDCSMGIRAEDRVHLRGPNGSGKSTLANALVASRRVPEERILFVPQEFSEAEGTALLEALRHTSPERRAEICTLLAALGIDPEALLASASPSPGEARKLAFAEGLSRRVWLAVLDEPTNHLDLPSVERLEAALADYPGALLLVTHDDRFAERLTNQCWEIGEGDLRLR